MSLRSPEDLLRRLDRPNLRICDVRWWLVDPPRGRREYEAGHIPGAIFVDVDTDLVGSEGPGRHPLPDPATFACIAISIGTGESRALYISPFCAAPAGSANSAQPAKSPINRCRFMS